MQNQNNGATPAQNPNRQILKTLSATAKTLVQEGIADSINEALIEIYKTDGKGEIFKPFNTWLAEGFRVKKGEKALFLWGKKRTGKPQDQEEGEYKFFPIAYVFSDLQVEPLENKVEEEGEKYGCSEIEISYKSDKTFTSKPSITCSADAEQLLRPFYKNIELKEYSYILFLNHALNPIGVYELSSGGLTSTIIDIRIVMATALKCQAVNIILSHNHPSGKLLASEADINITNRIKKACEYFDIHLRDHLILTSTDYYSFSDKGLI